MLSHTVPKSLLERFAFVDPITRSNRLWRYQKGLPPYGRAAPKTSTRWDGHFADPENAAKEAEIELRLKREFEDPVNEFLNMLWYETFVFTPTYRRLLAGYVTMLFHRSRARRAASAGQSDKMLDALRSLRDNEERLGQLIAKYTMDLLANGLRHMVTRAEVIAAIDARIAEQSKVDAPQLRYIETMETMMKFADHRMQDGDWRVLHATAEHPFVIGDAPVVTWERTAQDMLVFGMGFGRHDVEAILPLSPTVCLHILPAVERTRRIRSPAVDEVNQAQAALATAHCFANIYSTELDRLLQPFFGTVRLGKEGFNIDHLDGAEKLFEILMHQPPLHL